MAKVYDLWYRKVIDRETRKAKRVPTDSAVTLVLVALFQVITAPVISQLVGRSAYRSGAVRPEVLVVDELAERTRRAGGPPPQ